MIILLEAIKSPLKLHNTSRKLKEVVHSQDYHPFLQLTANYGEGRCKEAKTMKTTSLPLNV